MAIVEPDLSEQEITPEAIREFGYKELYRALNIGRLIGFVGSGVTIVYGRVNWQDLVKEIKDSALADYEVKLAQGQREAEGPEDDQDDEAAEAEAGAVEGPDDTPDIDTSGFADDAAARQAGDLRKVIESIDKVEPQGMLRHDERNILLLELSEKLYSVLSPDEDIFRDKIKAFFRDDRAYAEKNLERRLKFLAPLIDRQDLLKKARHQKAKDSVERQRANDGTMPEADPYHRLFYNVRLLKEIQDALERAQQDSTTIDTALEEQFLKDAIEKCGAIKFDIKVGPAGREGQDGNQATGLASIMPPDRRSFFSIVFAAILYCDQQLALEARQAGKDAKDGACATLRDAIHEAFLSALTLEPAGTQGEEQQASGQPHVPPFALDRGQQQSMQKDRLDYARPKIDPIHKIFTQLRIKRFLTTNYDLELERYLEHHDFRIGALTDDLVEVPGTAPRRGRSSTIENRSRLGRLARSMVFRKDSSAELIEFAAGMPNIHTDIFHLHGRAGSDDPLVATERDYQNTYLRTDETRRIFYEALDTIFTGNPVLFIGLGMSEADLLRPLRQFVSDHRGGEVRPLFALLPGTGSRSNRDAIMLSLYIRYGVNTIFFGERRPDQADTKPDLASQEAFVNGLIKALRPLDEAMRRPVESGEGETPPSSSDPSSLNGNQTRKLKRAVRDIERHLLGSEEEDESDLAQKENREAFKQCLSDGFDSKFAAFLSSRLPIVHDMDVDAVALKYVLKRLSQDLRLAEKATKQDRQGMAPEAPNHDVLRRCAGPILDYLKRLREKILAAALCKEIDQIASGWHGWWDDWAKIPGSRETEESWRQEKERGIWIRHELDFSDLDGSITLGAEEDCEKKDEKRLKPFFNAWWALLHEVGRCRLVISVYNEKGGGKGYFYHRLQERAKKATPQGGTPDAKETPDDKVTPFSRYQFCFFANASYSCEYTSVIDSVIEFFNEISHQITINAKKKLHGTAKKPEIADSIAQLNRVQKRYSGSREAQRNGPGTGQGQAIKRDTLLREQLSALQTFFNNLPDGVVDNGDAGFGRYLIAFNNIDLLFSKLKNLPLDEKSNRYIEPITTELQNFFKVLLDRDYGKVPLDIIAIGGSEGSRRYFARASEEPEGEDTAGASESGASQKSGAATSETNGGDVGAEPHSFMFLDHELDRIEFPEEAIATRVRDVLTLSGAAPQPQGPSGQAAEDAVALIKRIYETGTRRSFVALSLIAEALTWQAKRGPREGHSIDILSRLMKLDHSLKVAPQVKATDGVIDHLLALYTEDAQRRHDTEEKARIALRNYVLRHMAFFSVPVEPIVLGQCPEIIALISDYRSSFGGKRSSPLLREEFKKMAQLGLVIPVKKRKEDNEDLRYALHRQIQQYIFNRMGSPRHDRGEANFYDLSIYAIQPRDMPTLSKEIYRFLDDLLAGLTRTQIGWPDLRTEAADDDGAQGLGHEPFDWSKEDEDPRSSVERWLRTAPKCHRAALGILRSSFSITVLSRLSGGGRSDQDAGVSYFEAYGKRLRELLDAAIKWDERRVTIKDKIKAAGGEGVLPGWPGVARAFYSDEIAWLFNERGLVALTQGRLYDAIPLFNQALKANERVEGSDKGANWSRIALNLAIAHIERGNMGRATGMLRDIIQTETSEPIRLIATGYGALIRHLEGRLVEASEQYRHVIGGLARTDRTRAVAIFSKHLGDLYRAMDNDKKARSWLNRAVAAAETGQHQDVLHHARVSQAFIVYKDGAHRALPMIDTSLRYARAMGIYRLEAEALNIRAQLILGQGENEYAGELAVRYLSLCTMHGMTLRKISALILMGHISLHRDDKASGLHLLRTAAHLAERVGHQLLVERAQQLILAAESGPDDAFTGMRGVELWARAYTN